MSVFMFTYVLVYVNAFLCECESTCVLCEHVIVCICVRFYVGEG